MNMLTVVSEYMDISIAPYYYVYYLVPLGGECTMVVPTPEQRMVPDSDPRHITLYSDEAASSDWDCCVLGK